MITVSLTPLWKDGSLRMFPRLPLVSLGNEWQCASRWQVEAKKEPKKKEKKNGAGAHACVTVTHTSTEEDDSSPY